MYMNTVLYEEVLTFYNFTRFILCLINDTACMVVYTTELSNCYTFRVAVSLSTTKTCTYAT